MYNTSFEVGSYWPNNRPQFLRNRCKICEHPTGNDNFPIDCFGLCLSSSFGLYLHGNSKIFRDLPERSRHFVNVYSRVSYEMQLIVVFEVFNMGSWC